MKIKVLKFGGASVNNAEAVRNIAVILKKYQKENVVVLVSAMDKITNAFEGLCCDYFYEYKNLNKHLESIKKYHYGLLNELFKDKRNIIFSEIDSLFKELKQYIDKKIRYDFDFEYDQIVPYGELLSSKIISYYLNEVGIYNRWYDVRELIKTDKTYREAKVNWEQTINLINKTLLPFFSKNNDSQKIALTQGFIGSTLDNKTSTLGREGSDFSAAIFAHSLNAKEVIIWKDVPGLLNADPKYFKETKKIDNISYKEAIELSYYGAKVIHPKTIKPLENKKIPLIIKSFVAPDNKGSLIYDIKKNNDIIPSYIIKKNQVLLSISSKDFSFIVEKNLSFIFKTFDLYSIKINLMQNSAISFSACVDYEEYKIKQLTNKLKKNYNIKYNKNLELITIRHYNQSAVDKVIKGKEILLEQKSRSTIQMIVKNN